MKYHLGLLLIVMVTFSPILGVIFLSCNILDNKNRKRIIKVYRINTPYPMSEDEGLFVWELMSNDGKPVAYTQLPSTLQNAPPINFKTCVWIQGVPKSQTLDERELQEILEEEETDISPDVESVAEASDSDSGSGSDGGGDGGD